MAFGAGVPVTAARPTNNLAGGRNLLLWTVGAVTAFLLLFWLITLALRLPFWPDAITKNAGLFVNGARTTLYLTVISGVLGWSRACCWAWASFLR